MLKGQIFLILHNIRSAYNVGSIFRTADGVGITKIYLCGITPTPETAKVSKTSLGAEKTVPWEYQKQTWRLLKQLSAKGRLVSDGKKIQIVALERLDRLTASKLNVQNIFKYKPKFPLALIVGNEVSGLNKKILSRADKIVEIPMYGKKESLNVAVATGIALYKIRQRT